MCVLFVPMNICCVSADQGEPFAQYLSIPGCSDTRDGLRRCTCENYSSLPKSVDNFKPRNSLPEGTTQCSSVSHDHYEHIVNKCIEIVYGSFTIVCLSMSLMSMDSHLLIWFLHHIDYGLW